MQGSVSTPPQVAQDSLNVEMLKSICSHFEISFKSRDRKHQLIEKLAAMIAKCSCGKS